MPSPSRVLALDFDGVVVDALRECAAVTYFSGLEPGEPPRLESALQAMPNRFLARFIAMRPYCRTLADFMVANHVGYAVSSRQEYEQARAAVPEALLEHQAKTGEVLRSTWRAQDKTLWLESHSVHAPVIDVLRQWQGQRWIISAKDGDSIRAILQHHHVLDLIDRIAGSCRSKAGALREASAQGEVLFIDDNLDHVLSACHGGDAMARWARWGYAAPEDDDRARAAGVEVLHLGDLAGLSQQHRSAIPLTTSFRKE